MKQTNQYIYDMLDMDNPEASGDIVWQACNPVDFHESDDGILFKVPFKAGDRNRACDIIVRAYGGSVVRLTTSFNGENANDANVINDANDTNDKNDTNVINESHDACNDSLMLQWDSSMKQDMLIVKNLEGNMSIVDDNGNPRVKIVGQGKESGFNLTILPDGTTPIPFNANDSFMSTTINSIALGFIERKGKVHRSFFSLKASHDDKFSGTGERFRNINLSGQTILLENEDAHGVNSRRAYKNIPFFLSSVPYGLFIHTSAYTRLSLADISTCAAQGMVEDEKLDLFFIGGGSLERILYNYRRITGFPSDVPLWSYGIWMSKLSYYSAKEILQVAKRLRDEGFPCDVIHIDTGWFEKPWKCDWEFSAERYPDPPAMINELRNMGFRISLWQLPFVSSDTKIYETAKNKGFLKIEPGADTGSVFGSIIDFTNPKALEWYKGMLKNLIAMGVSVIKTDFGENIKMKAEYYGLPAKLLHNLYCLIYQKAAFEATEQMNGEGIIWARAGWAGCQRYPVHWGGDSVSTWDGLAGSIKGGLHLGLSGFAFWSHDTPGFYCNTEKPDNDLYVRWTQVSVFSSHMRYHGISDREPYNYPEVADIVRKWQRLRYAMIPYLADQGKKSVKSGFPVLRAMIFHHEKDPVCWNISDQFYCGDSLLIAPILNSEGIRDIYLPEGKWMDFWTGDIIKGPVYLKNIKTDLEHIPVYAKAGTSIEVYCEEISCTDEMDPDKVKRLVFDDTFRGIKKSELGELTGL